MGPATVSTSAPSASVNVVPPIQNGAAERVSAVQPASDQSAEERQANIMGRAPASPAQSVYALIQANEARAAKDRADGGISTTPAQPKDLIAKMQKAKKGYTQLA
ncbi:MAG: hypothetical protein MK098_00285 [Marinovum sp.]|nr:hypothetical protein [Marinovum sp.]